jgi:hypothetical protein
MPTLTWFPGPDSVTKIGDLPDRTLIELQADPIRGEHRLVISVVVPKEAVAAADAQELAGVDAAWNRLAKAALGDDGARLPVVLDVLGREQAAQAQASAQADQLREEARRVLVSGGDPGPIERKAAAKTAEADCFAARIRDLQAEIARLRESVEYRLLYDQRIANEAAAVDPAALSAAAADVAQTIAKRLVPAVLAGRGRKRALNDSGGLQRRKAFELLGRLGGKAPGKPTPPAPVAGPAGPGK